MANSEGYLWIPGSPGSWVEHSGILIQGGGYASKNAIYGVRPDGSVHIIKTNQDQVLKTVPEARSEITGTTTALPDFGDPADYWLSAELDCTDWTRVVGIAKSDSADLVLYVQQSKVFPFVVGQYIEYPYSFEEEDYTEPDGTTGQIFVCRFGEMFGDKYVRILVRNNGVDNDFLHVSAWRTTVER